MRFEQTELDGLVIVETELHRDERGAFARTFCATEFAHAGLPSTFLQCNISCNGRRGTLRGLHYQDDPYPEGKLIRCTRGAAFDVAVDIRPGSPTRYRWVSVELTARNARAIWIPPGFAHGFMTLTDDTELFYQMTESYRPELARGLGWNDPAFGIDWPIGNPILSPRDASFPHIVR